MVLSQYMNDPLCTAGSLLHSRRFNFGNISYDYQNFACLYISSNSEGAKCEKFPNPPDPPLLSASEMSLIPDGSFLTSRCEVNLTKCIDIRTEDSLRDFTKIISQINPTERFQNKWKKMNRKVRGERANSLNIPLRISLLNDYSHNKKKEGHSEGSLNLPFIDRNTYL